MNQEIEIIHSDKKFGFITQSKLMLTKDKASILFESIEKVNLIKYRVLYTNLLLMFLSSAILFSSFFWLRFGKTIIYSFIFIGLSILIFSIQHKFYFYRLVIKEKNETTHIIKTSQFNRKCIKEFYFLVVSKVREKNKKK